MKYKIPQVNPYFTKDEEKEVLDSLRNAWVTEGPKAKSFISEMLSMTKAKYGVLAPNGTLALYMSLMVLGISPGDEVIVPDFTMIASSNAVYLTGATPVFVDVRIDDLNIDSTRRDDILVLRRSSGGGTVLQGRGCLNYSLVLSKERNPQLQVLRASYEFILGKIISALKKISVGAVFKPISDMNL